jgi:hypothetical protein
MLVIRGQSTFFAESVVLVPAGVVDNPSWVNQQEFLEIQLQLCRQSEEAFLKENLWREGSLLLSSKL